LSAINLDDEAPFAADKIDVIRPERLLPDEFAAAELPVSKLLPQQ